MSRCHRQHNIPGRGAVSNPAGRFEATVCEAVDDGWGSLEGLPPKPVTEVVAEPARQIISHNRSPDIPFSQSINPYRGCEHGCIYCYARPAHAYVNLSPGLDFETRLAYKSGAAERLREALARPGYRCSPIAFGANTDPYQPIESRYRVTRELLEVLLACRHPVSIVTKGAVGLLRDMDLLRSLAQQSLVAVYLSMTTLDEDLKRRLEPRAASAAARLRAIRALSDAGVPVGVMVAPVIPVLTDAELEAILAAARAAGARTAGYILLRLPHEVAPLFDEWLDTHRPLQAEHVRSRLAALRNGRRNDPRFGTRLTGEGVYAQLLARRFALARQRLGYETGAGPALQTGHFQPPLLNGQLALL